MSNSIAFPFSQAADDVQLAAARDLMKKMKRTVWSGLSSDSDHWRAALCMIVPVLDVRCKLYKLAEAVPQSGTTYTEADFYNSMANLGYYMDSVDIELSDIDARLMPCLFIPDNTGSPLIALTQGRIYDPGSDRIRNDLPAGMAGKACFFQPYQEDKEPTSKNMRAGTGHTWFRALIGRFRNIAWQVVALGVVLNLIALATPLFIMLVYDRVIAAHAQNTLLMLAVGVGAGVLIEWGLRNLRSRRLSWLAARLDNIVGNKIFDHLLHLSPTYIERASIASQVARMKTFESVRDFFSGPVFLSLLEMPFVVIALAAIGIIAGPLVLVPIVMAGLYLILFFSIWHYVKVAIRVAAKAGSARGQFLLEMVEKLDAMHASGLSEAYVAKFRELSAREALTSFRLGWLGMIGETLANALTVLSAVAVIGFGVGLVWAGHMTVGALVATMILVWKILTPFYNLCTMIPRIDQIRNSIRQVNRLMDLETETAPLHKQSPRLEHMKGRISFQNVGMRYAKGSDPLFAGLTFEAMPGDIVAVTGSNGAGKTTLLKIVKGMYAPQAGSIRIDGFDIRQIDPLDLRRHIAYIPQNAHFFRGTVMENLRFANPLASTREMEMALGQAGVLEDIRALPQGLDTIIGVGSGISLSSSLELRLSMVRAYLHDAPVLLVDELPNSLLSEQAGAFMRDHLLRHKKERTVIIVTHREDFLELANTVVMLRRGLPPQVGPRSFMVEKLKHTSW